MSRRIYQTHFRSPESESKSPFAKFHREHRKQSRTNGLAGHALSRQNDLGIMMDPEAPYKNWLYAARIVVGKCLPRLGCMVFLL
jgi:hypothetical protein